MGTKSHPLYIFLSLTIKMAHSLLLFACFSFTFSPTVCSPPKRPNKDHSTQTPFQMAVEAHHLHLIPPQLIKNWYFHVHLFLPFFFFLDFDFSVLIFVCFLLQGNYPNQCTKRQSLQRPDGFWDRESHSLLQLSHW